MPTGVEDSSRVEAGAIKKAASNDVLLTTPKRLSTDCHAAAVTVPPSKSTLSADETASSTGDAALSGARW